MIAPWMLAADGAVGGPETQTSPWVFVGIGVSQAVKLLLILLFFPMEWFSL